VLPGGAGRTSDSASTTIRPGVACVRNASGSGAGEPQDEAPSADRATLTGLRPGPCVCCGHSALALCCAYQINRGLLLSTAQRSVATWLSPATFKRQHAARPRCLVAPPTCGEAPDPWARPWPAVTPIVYLGLFLHRSLIEASMRHRPIEIWVDEGYRGSHRAHRTDVTSAGQPEQGPI